MSRTCRRSGILASVILRLRCICASVGMGVQRITDVEIQIRVLLTLQSDGKCTEQANRRARREFDSVRRVLCSLSERDDETGKR